MEDALNHDRIASEIAKLMAETSKLNAEAEKLRAEREKLVFEGTKLSWEVFWYPVFIASALVGSVAAVTIAITRFVQ